MSTVPWEMVALAWTTLASVVGMWIRLEHRLTVQEERVHAIERRVRDLELMRAH